MAFVVAGIIVVATIVWCGLEMFGAMMSDSGYAAADASSRAVTHLIIGLAIAAVVGGSHWIHWSW